MSFPRSLAGSLDVETRHDAPDDSVRRVKAAISEWLANKCSQKTTETASGIEFKHHWSRITFGPKPVMPLAFGEIRIENKDGLVRIAYDVDYVATMKVATAMCLVVAVFPQIQAAEFNLLMLIGVFAISWVLLYGLNYLLCRNRFPTQLRSVAQDAIGKTA